MRRSTFAAAASTAALAAGLAFAWRVPDAGAGEPRPGEGYYEFELPLAPVCLDGTYPLSIETDAGALAGDANLTTDPRGRLSGDVTLGGTAFTLSGRVRCRDGEETISLVASAGKHERIRLGGSLAGAVFAGEADGASTVLDGRRPFTLDVAAAAPQTASVWARIEGAKGKRFRGVGSAQVCGAPVLLKARGRGGSKLDLTLSGGGFRWNGKGLLENRGTTVAWTAKGFGARAQGEDFRLDVLPPPPSFTYPVTKGAYEQEVPIPPNAPLISGGLVLDWSVSPELPAGLSFDPETGLIAGTPTTPAPETDHVVRAANAAGESQVKLRLSVRLNRAYSLAKLPGAPTDEDLRHFLVRTHFGVRQQELDRVAERGLDKYVDDMLELESGTAWEQAAFAELVNANDPAGLEGGFPNTAQLARWWQHLMTTSGNPFQEHLALFWHDHFAASSEILDGSQYHYMVRYVNLFRHEGTGNLRDLLVNMAREPAMLVYLDGFRNSRTAPNENFAREFWELFTLGVDNGYTQADIVQASRAFTGWRQRYNQATGQSYMEFDAGRHDSANKTFLGVTVPGQNATDDFQAVADVTLANRPAAEFLVRKLFEHYCYVGPPQELVDELAAVLRSNDYELKPLLRTLFRSEAFFSPRARDAHVKNPVEFGVGFIRTTGLQISYRTLDAYLLALAQRPTQPPVVDGWPSGVLWLSSQAMIDRTNLVHQCIEDTAAQRAAGIEVADVLPPPQERTAEAVVDVLARLMRIPLSAADRAAFVDYLNTQRLFDGSTVASPFDGTNQQHLDERVRGLLWILAQHPAYHVR